MRLGVVIPVLDDWAAAGRLIGEIAGQFRPEEVELGLCLVDDGSVESFDPAGLDLPEAGSVGRVEVLQLALNLGHQRAIAIGLCHLVAAGEVDAIAVMDGDGEDRPEDLPRLVAASRAAPGRIVVVQRAERTESRSFKLGYVAYVLMFHLLVGRRMRFGNFSLLPLAAARRLVYMPELWNNFPASIIRSRLPVEAIKAPRGHRYAGRSRMNFTSLVAHGLSAMSVYTDVIAARILIGSALVGALALLGLLAVALIRLLTLLAIPGWATTAAGDLMIILLLTLVVVIATSLSMLSARGLRPMIPMVDAPGYVVGRKRRRRDPEAG